MDRTHQKLAMFMILVILTPAFAGAANYCVTPNGAGSKNGADWNNAYAGLPTTLERGSTYYLADGTYSSYTFNTPVSGTKTVTIKKAIDSDHGTDTGWSLSYGDGQAVIPSLVIDSSYFVLDGQKGDGFSVLPPDDVGSHYGFWLSSTYSAITVGDNGPGDITNITIKHVYSATDINDPSAAGGGWFFAMSSANRNAAVSNLIISYSYLVGWGQALCMDWDKQWSNIVWEYNVYEQQYTSPTYHGNPINVRWASVSGLVVRYSLFFETVGSGGLSEVISANDNWIYNSKIYGNVFDQCWSGHPIIGANSGFGISNTVVYHNTFLRSAAGKDSEGGGVVEGTAGSGNVFQNNLVYSASANIGAGVSHDYNQYVFTTNTPSETHGVVVTTNSDPFVNYATKDYGLKASTPAGTTLGTEYAFDALGRPRTTWARGAFEYYSSGPVNGVCGTAARTYGQSETFPGAYALCSAGTAPATTPTLGSTAGATVTWTCAGQNGGTSTSCNATRSSTLNGACGPAARTYSETETFPAGAYCSAGTASPSSPADPVVGSSTSWKCLGSNGGTNASCIASRTNVLTLGLVGYWAFDESSGSARDSSGNGNNGTLVNSPARVTGKINGALSFNGYSYVQIPDNGVLQLKDAYTYTYWLNLASAQSGWAPISSKVSSGTTQQIDIEFCEDGRTLCIDHKSGWTATSVTLSQLTGGWHHLAVSYDGTNAMVYVDGVLKSTSAIAKPSGIGNGPLYLARAETDAGDGSDLKGTLDEVRVYNRALSASEVQQVYQYTGTSSNYHPADTSKDWKLSTAEVSTYNLCWKTPTCTPSPATTYVSNANLMWKSRADGAYHYAGGTCPLCWVSGA